MGKSFGIILMVITVWVVAEVTTKGMDRAFGGVFAGGAVAESNEPRRTTAQRAGDAVERARQQQQERYDDLLPE